MPDPATLLAAYDEQTRPAEAAQLPPGSWAEPDGPVVRIVGQHRGFISTPPDLELDGSDLDALIARQRHFFAARGEAVEWKTRGHDRPAGLVDRLVSAGFVAEPAETVMIGLAEDMAGEPAVPAEVTIRPTTDDTDMVGIAAMESDVWSEDLGWMADDLVARVGVGGEQITVFVAEAAGEVVSAAWIVLLPGTEFAALWGGSTRAAWRRRGIYRSLVARRAALATANGVRYLQVDASDASRPILERLGFVAVTTTVPYVWTPPPEAPA